MAIDDPELMDEEVAVATVSVSAEQALAALIDSPNLVPAMDDQHLAEISATVCREYDIDENSRSEWIKKNEEARKLATMVAEAKDYPFKNASNVKYPLIATAALQFNARSYPAIVASDRVVKTKVRGRDEGGQKAARGDRVSEYMSDQMLNEMPEWEADTDRLLIILPIEGSCFRKVWFDPALRRDVSRLVRAENFVVNDCASSIESAPRKTEKLYLYPYEIQERIRDGRFVEFDWKNTEPSDERPAEASEPDADAPHLFLEQHRLLDLDEDGYPEPYIVTVHHSTLKVVRIVANYGPDTVTFDETRTRVLAIRPESYFVHYQFMPNPNGGFYGMGFGWLLGATNETINTTINQMMDAGHLSNMQGGLISSVLGIREKKITLERGEWRVINTSMPLNQAVLPIKYDGPSDTLFKLLGLLIDMGKEVSATKDVLTGDTGGKTMQPTTVMALIEQGLQVFTAIYKRVHRSLKAEFAILARLNFKHPREDQYRKFFDADVSMRADFDTSDMDILPVSDPQSVTKMQKLTKAQMIYEISKDDPFFNPLEARKRLLEAADVEDWESLLMPPPEPDPAEVAFVEAMKQLELQDKVADIKKKLADGMKSIAQAEAEEEGSQVTFYKLFLEAIQAEIGAEQAANEQIGQGRVPGMEGQPPDAGGAGALSPAGTPGNGIDPASLAPIGDAGGNPVGGPAGAGGLSQGAL